MTTVLRGKEVANSIKGKLKDSVDELKKIQHQPSLAIVRVGEDPSSIGYENAAVRTMNQVGIEAQVRKFDSEVSFEEVLGEIDQLNQDPTVHGILVMQPLPERMPRNEVARRINPNKDIDGLTPENLGRLVEQDTEVLLPSTPLAVMELLEFYNIPLKGKDVAIIGSSPVVGKPLSIMMLNEHATVTNCHIHTKDIKKFTKEADILVSATGVIELISEDHIKEGAVVIDVGFGYKDGKATGDVQYESVKEKSSAITPVPGGIGAITTAVLAEQVLKSAWTHAKIDRDLG